MSKASETYPTVWCTVWFWTKQVGSREGGLPKTSQQLALLNKYLSALHRTNLLTVVLIKVDCWWDKNRLWPLCFFFLSRLGDLTAARTCFKFICRFFFSIHTLPFSTGLLNWHGRGESQKAPGQIFDVELRSHWTLCACQKTLHLTPTIFFMGISQKWNPSTKTSQISFSIF